MDQASGNYDFIAVRNEAGEERSKHQKKERIVRNALSWAAEIHDWNDLRMLRPNRSSFLSHGPSANNAKLTLTERWFEPLRNFIGLGNQNKQNNQKSATL